MAVTKGNPLASLASSRKVILAVAGLIAIVVLLTVSSRPWLELAVPVGGIVGLLGTLINGIAKEDAAAASKPTVPTTVVNNAPSIPPPSYDVTPGGPL